MEMRHTQRIFVSIPLAKGERFSPCAEHAHYLLNVLRMKTGDVLRVFNGKDGEFRCSVISTGKKTLDIEIHEQIRAQQAEPDLWLCCTPIKKAHFDYAVEKATELGVSEIQPILTSRTQIREINADRIYSICREAAEQSERLGVPAIGLPVDLKDFVDVFPHDRALVVCAEWGEAKPILETLRSAPFTKFSKAAIVVGPEGGFATEELDMLRKAPNAFFVRLGPRILRADTAAIAALTCWQAAMGDWKTS
jgi:16S rRNA (uracil1498-N3)-methyltransferase